MRKLEEKEGIMNTRVKIIRIVLKINRYIFSFKIEKNLVWLETD